jgi:hypothetical protein
VLHQCHQDSGAWIFQKWWQCGQADQPAAACSTQL